MKTNKRKYNKNVFRYFDRKFGFTKDSTWNLKADVYKENKFIIPEFQKRKHELNAVKEQLNNFDLNEWSNHTKSREPSTAIISTIKHSFKAELVTQAWCKFYECVSEFSVIPESSITKGQLNSVHLCEAPGAFICALNQYLKTHFCNIKWNWLGSTLNPYYEDNSEMIPDDRLIRHTYENWYFGSDLTGDITKYYNSTSLVDLVNIKGKVQLVTADGSIDCMDNPGDQEKTVEYLHYCEAMTALQILEAGGSFIIKLFTMFEESTICLMYLLNSCFSKVHVFKPCTSKSGNSEVYVICLNYTPIEKSIMSALLDPYRDGELEKSMFSLTSIPSSFLSQIYECALFFMERQILVINENVKYFRKMSSEQQRWITDLSNSVVAYFIKKYSITILPNDLKIVTDCNVGKSLYFMAEYFLTKEQEFMLYPRIYISQTDVGQILDIHIGKYLLTVHHSKYHTITNYSYNQNRVSKGLHNLAQSLLNHDNNIITFTDFENFYGVSKFHRLFFNEVLRKFAEKKNVIIVGVPLLTHFLVGLVFLVSLAFRKMWFLNNVIILEKPEEFKFKCVEEYLEIINKTYLDIDNSTDAFTKDIMHIVPLECIYNKGFIKIISKYNDCILKYKYN